MSLEVTGLGGFILLVFDLWAIIKTIDSSVPTGTKVLWTILILFLPILGLLLWLLFGPKADAPV